MKFKNDTERKAFKYIVDIASEAFSRRGCNDLSDDELLLFSHLRVRGTDDDGKPCMRRVCRDFDVLEWLLEQTE